MANYVITAPNGKKYKVTGQGSKEEALQALQSQLGGGEQPTQPFNPRDFSLPAMGIDVDANMANYDKQQFDNLPMWQKPLVAADDIVSLAANSATLGAIPWAASHARSWAKGSDYETERAAMDQNMQEARNRAGGAGLGAEVAGGIKGALSLAGKGITATRGLGQTGGLIADGAALGGASSYFNDQDPLTGAVVGGGLGAAGAGLGKLGGNLMQKYATSKMQNAAPSFDEVAAQKNALYGQLENAGVKFDANSFANVVTDIESSVANFRARAPYTSELAQNLSQYKGVSPGFRDVEDILSEAKAILREPSATVADKAAARGMVEKLSNYFDSAPLMTNGSVPANEIAPIAKQAREVARRNILARDVKEMERKADWYVSGRESGMRNQATSYGKRNGRSLSAAEEAALKAVTQREGIQDVITKAGSGLGQHLTAGLGFGLGGLPGAAAGYGAHFTARKIGERATKKSTEKLMKTILAGRKAQAAAKPSAKALSYLNNAIRIGVGGGAAMAPTITGLFGYHSP